jgi:2'-5' RNA ligase
MSTIGPNDHMRDHWWWRPGWRMGRSMYTWHVTFDDQSQLHELVSAYHSALRPLPGLDLIPARWLHLTMQGIGFTNEISDREIADIADTARKRLANQRPVSLTVGPASIDPEAVMFEVTPANALTPVRDAIRAAISDVRGLAEVPESEEWTPHISLAYSNSDGLAAPYVSAVDRVSNPPVTLTISKAHLIELNRDAQLYQWTTKAEVSFSG